MALFRSFTTYTLKILKFGQSQKTDLTKRVWCSFSLVRQNHTNMSYSELIGRCILRCATVREEDTCRVTVGIRYFYIPCALLLMFATRPCGVNFTTCESTMTRSPIIWHFSKREIQYLSPHTVLRYPPTAVYDILVDSKYNSSAFESNRDSNRLRNRSAWFLCTRIRRGSIDLLIGQSINQ